MLLIDTAPAGDGAEDARFGVLRGGNLGEIVRKDDEIRVLAGFQLAFLSILELRVGGTGGVSADAILERNFLLRLPTVSRTAIRAFARAGSLGDRFENVEGYAIGAIADGVESQLEPGLVALNGHRGEFFRIVGKDSTGRGIVGIRLEHRRSARTHSSIREGFQRTGL